MNTFVNAIDLDNQVAYDTSIQRTDNDAISYASSLNHNVDLFFRIGSARGQNLNAEFDKAFHEDEDTAIRMLQWVRDVRGGSGERETFRSILKHMESQSIYHSALEKIIHKIPEIGRWDDLFVFQSEKFKTIAYTLVSNALKVGNGLCSKWTPRERSNRKEDRQVAKELMTFMNLTPKQYRKMLVDGTSVVETQMCDQKWSEINFQAVPSVASRRYSKAFGKNCGEPYVEYLKKAIEGGAKINASAIFPYDVTSVATQWNANEVLVMAAEAQWDALPNYMNGKRILPIIDTSSSMSSIVPGTKHSHMHMAISIGMYVAEKNTGAFKNVFLTFSSTPTMNVIPSNQNIVKRYQTVKGSDWGGSTDLQASFELILDHAIRNKVPNDEMPEIVILPSDMAFNQADRNFNTNYQAIRNKFENAGYTVPKLVFWQMNGSKTGSPVRSTQAGVSLISGFSPAILKAVLGDTEVKDEPKEDPIETMKKALYVERYNWQ